VRVPSRSAAITVVVAATLAVGFLFATVIPAVACSCIGPQPMAAYADGRTAIFTGVVQAPDERGVPVQVGRWFFGEGRAPTVWLSDGPFHQQGSACGTGRPPPGTEWIFVAYRTDDGGLRIDGCSPHARSTTQEGLAMFADAVGTFGDPPPSRVNDMLVGLLPMALVAAGAIVLFVAGERVVRRRRPPTDVN
jgi:hypothetical protein